MEYRRPILQEMDTQEYDRVRLYTEKSPAKPFSTASLAILFHIKRILVSQFQLILYKVIICPSLSGQ